MDTEALGKFAGALVQGMSEPQDYQAAQAAKVEKREKKEQRSRQKFHDDLHAFAVGGAASKRFMATYAMAEIHQPELARGLRDKARFIRQEYGLEVDAPHLQEPLGTFENVPKEYAQRGQETVQSYAGDPTGQPFQPDAQMPTIEGTMSAAQYRDAVDFAVEFNASPARAGRAPMSWEEAVELRAQGKTRFDLGF
jgi:hypothetical protein